MKYSLVLLLLFAVGGPLLWAQNDTNATLIDNMLEEVDLLLDDHAYQQADSIAREALQLAEANKDTGGQAGSLHKLGLSAEFQGLWKDSYYYYNQSLALWTDLGDSLNMGRVCRDIAIMKDSEGDHYTQLKFAERALSIFEAIDDTLRIGDSYINLANARKNMGDNEGAKIYFQRAVDIFEPRGDRLDAAIAYYGLGDVYFLTGKLDSAKAAIAMAMPVFVNEEEIARTAYASNILGLIAAAEDDTAQAKKRFKDCIDSARAADDSLSWFDACINLAHIELEEDNLKLAEDYFKQAAALIGESGGVLDNVELNSLRKELAYSRKAIASIIKIEELQRSRLYNNIIIAALFILLFFFCIFFVLVLRKRKLEHEATKLEHEATRIQHEKDKLQHEKILHRINEDLYRAREKGELEERERLRKRVHNEIGSQLAAVRWGLESLTSRLPDHSESLAKISQLIQEAYGNARNIERLLVEKRQDWLAKISDFFELLPKFENDKLEIRFSNHCSEKKLEHPVGAQLYDIIKVAVANVLTHAKADHLTCELNRLDDQLTVLIQDDGQGFDPLEATSGSGLKNIRQIVEKIKGQIEIDSAKGEGTTITCTIPID